MARKVGRNIVNHFVAWKSNHALTVISILFMFLSAVGYVESKPGGSDWDMKKVADVVEGKREVKLIITSDGRWELSPGMTEQQKIICISVAAAILLLLICCCVCVCKICCGNNIKRPRTTNIIYQQLSSPVPNNNKNHGRCVSIKTIS